MENSIIAVTDSLGWALLHSIWQVSLFAILAFAALALVRRNNPRLRFLIAYACMLGSAAAFVITFAVYLQGFSPTISMAGQTAAEASQVVLYLQALGKMMWLVSLCWAIGFVMLSTRYLQALRATARLRTTGIERVPEEWELRFRLWAERLGADARTLIRYSSAVSTPVTIGILKPLVLVPSGFFLRLPREQAEAILVHEIAHVCRQDYLLGLVQAMVHTVFFFHPAMHFLSRQIDIEREHACDAWAASETGDATALARGLSHIALESRVSPPGFAMAADGGRTPLMDRISRLANRPTRHTTSAGTPLAMLGMTFAASLMIAIGADAATGIGFNANKVNDPETARRQPRHISLVAVEDVAAAGLTAPTPPTVATSHPRPKVGRVNRVAQIPAVPASEPVTEPARPISPRTSVQRETSWARGNPHRADNKTGPMIAAATISTIEPDESDCEEQNERIAEAEQDRHFQLASMTGINSDHAMRIAQRQRDIHAETWRRMERAYERIVEAKARTAGMEEAENALMEIGPIVQAEGISIRFVIRDADLDT